MLPVDPAAEPPPGYTAAQRGQPGGFAADPDVLDTWATSSLTPRIAAASAAGVSLDQIYPMDMRPQAHEIIRTWLFYTVLRAHLADGVVPWRHAAISGWILDPDRKKMSKSRGNVVTPMDSLRQHGSDAVRYWAASGRLGTDMIFDPAQLRVGRRLAIKILNASKFILSLPGPDAGSGPGQITEVLDRAMLARLADVVDACTAAFEEYEHTRALQEAESFFWFFCDDYLELVKSRAYREHGARAAGSAIAALRTALSVLLRLFAPVLPFVTEEVWSWWQDESVHRAAWPDPAELRALAGRVDPGALAAASAAIRAVRGAKSAARLSMRAPVRKLVISAAEDSLPGIRAVLSDVQAAGKVDQVVLSPSACPEPVHHITL
jgi:valyl-tRNA synthetase